MKINKRTIPLIEKLKKKLFIFNE
jgi:hypothetical protein